MGLLPAGFVPITQRAPGPSQGRSLSRSCLLSIIYKSLGSYPGGLAQRPEAALSPESQALPPLLNLGRQCGSWDPLAPLSGLSHSACAWGLHCILFSVFLTPHLAALSQRLFPQGLLPCPVDLSL